jgi:SAM-dependent methyltransferase
VTGDQKQLWETGLEAEMLFWREVLSGERPEFYRQIRERLDPQRPLQGGLRALLEGRDLKRAKVLDVAAGPVSWCGWHVDGQRIDLTAVDALADTYSAILDEYGLRPPVRTINGQAETLSELFLPGTFDLVHILNAIDHCYDPVEALRAMLRVAKPDGVVFLQGNINEAEEARYDGLHQWNIDVRDGRLLFWNPRSHIYADECLGDVTIAANAWPSDRWMNATIRKRAAVG